MPFWSSVASATVAVERTSQSDRGMASRKVSDRFAIARGNPVADAPARHYVVISSSGGLGRRQLRIDVEDARCRPQDWQAGAWARRSSKRLHNSTVLDDR